MDVLSSIQTSNILQLLHTIVMSQERERERERGEVLSYSSAFLYVIGSYNVCFYMCNPAIAQRRGGLEINGLQCRLYIKRMCQPNCTGVWPSSCDGTLNLLRELEQCGKLGTAHLSEFVPREISFSFPQATMWCLYCMYSWDHSACSVITGDFYRESRVCLDRIKLHHIQDRFDLNTSLMRYTVLFSDT